MSIQGLNLCPLKGFYFCSETKTFIENILRNKMQEFLKQDFECILLTMFSRFSIYKYQLKRPWIILELLGF